MAGIHTEKEELKMHYKRKSTWHILHLILTIIFLPWVLIWVFCTLSNNSHNRAMDHQELMQALLYRSEIPDTVGRINKEPNKANWKE